MAEPRTGGRVCLFFYFGRGTETVRAPFTVDHITIRAALPEAIDHARCPLQAADHGNNVHGPIATVFAATVTKGIRFSLFFFIIGTDAVGNDRSMSVDHQYAAIIAVEGVLTW
jgi:hypothetical protein